MGSKIPGCAYVAFHLRLAPWLTLLDAPTLMKTTPKHSPQKVSLCPHYLLSVPPQGASLSMTP